MDQADFGSRLQALRKAREFSLEELAERAGLHRTAIGLIERGEREPTLSTALKLAAGLGASLDELVPIPAAPLQSRLRGRVEATATGFEGITPQQIGEAVRATHAILDAADEGLLRRHYGRMASHVESVNLSGMVGNIFANELAARSGGHWIRNTPNKHPDLIRPPGTPGKDASIAVAMPTAAPAPSGAKTMKRVQPGVEIKVALNSNMPKGHHPRPNKYIVVRYVIGKSEVDAQIATVYEVLVGEVTESDFTVSDTEGDSGKTAVITADAIARKFSQVYFDAAHFPGNAAGYLERRRLLAGSSSSPRAPKQARLRAP